MQPSILLRLASATSFLLFAGHSAGGISGWSPLGRTAVLDSMQSFQFPVDGFARSYWHFYMGFGLVISLYLLAQTILFWWLASWAKVEPAQTRPLVALFLAVAVGTAVLDWLFFFLAPLVMTVVIAAWLALALLALREVREGSQLPG